MMHFYAIFFLSSLQGPTLSWFHRLLANSITLFRKLFETFATHYLCSVRRKQSVATLFHVKMERGESIRSFMKRFGGAILQLDEVSMDTIMQAIFPNTPFFNSISLKPPVSMDELFQIANKYSILKDDLRVATHRALSVAHDNDSRGVGRSKNRSSSRSDERRRAVYDRGVRRGRPFTPLMLSYPQLLPLIQVVEGFEWPQPMRSDPEQRDKTRFCEFPKDPGH